jgi:protein phosphatase 2C family protein 2/3
MTSGINTALLQTTSVSSQGPREYMEDTYVFKKIGKDKALFAVFDGHGGDAVAKMCADLTPQIAAQIVAEEHDVGIALRRIYAELDNQCIIQNLSMSTGACAAIVIVTKERIWFSNCGDTMTVVFDANGAQLMSEEHKVSNEISRLEKAGAIITHYDCPRIFGGLNIARSIGDHAQKLFVPSTPYICSTHIQRNGVKWFAIASDGIWDVMDHNEFAKVHNELMPIAIKPAKALSTIVSHAYQRGSGDNITVVYCNLDSNKIKTE